jgi:tRNA(Ile)-lysidine synthase
MRIRRSSTATALRRSLEHCALLRPGDRVAVAVSGGADSVALLLLLIDLREKLGLTLSVAHFNHKLRGTASDADEKFVAKLAAKHVLPLHLGKDDLRARSKHEKTNLEDACRRARQAFFAKLAPDGHIDKVAVAHTADDQAETVLAHILRGTGLAGLGGIHPQAGVVVRPLLKVRRAALRTYLRERRQLWREDATNRDTTKMRARIRKTLVPLLEKKFQSAVVAHLASLAELAAEDELFLDAVVEQQASLLVTRTPVASSISVSELLSPWQKTNNSVTDHTLAALPKKDPAIALQKRLLRCIVAQVKQQHGQLTARHVDAILDLAQRGENGKALSLPGGVEVRRHRDILMFHTQPNSRALEPRAQSKHLTQHASKLEYHYQIDALPSEQVLRVSKPGCEFRFTLVDWLRKRGETTNIGAVLDRDRLSFPLVLRSWRPGDQLHLQGHRNAQKLKRLLNEKGVSRWERDGWPVLTSGEVLVWAWGFPVAAGFAADERTQVAIAIAERNLW